MSNKFVEAVSQDIAGNYDEAIKNYEDAIFENENIHTDAFANLAFIYWNLAFASPFEIKPDIADRWSIIGGQRYLIILEMGIKSQADTLELIFWKRYFAHIVFGEDFTPEECEAMIESHSASKSRVPYFFLWLFDKKKYIAERVELLRQCEEEPTTKNRYIISILSTRT
jgi:tetratricopeptide (TPR) repeat protein